MRCSKSMCRAALTLATGQGKTFSWVETCLVCWWCGGKSPALSSSSHNSHDLTHGG